MTKHYLISFKPLGQFFFGGEQTFGSGEQANYFVKSNYFPQQTGILGLLRYELLLQYDLLSAVGKGDKVKHLEGKIKPEELIGPQSFHINGSQAKIDFGAIKKLSPLFMQGKDKQTILPAPFDVRCDNIYKTYTLSQLPESKTNLAISAIALSYEGKEEPEYYSEKDGIKHQFINDESKLFQHLPRKDKLGKPIFKKRSETDEAYRDYIFIENQKIGIHKAGDDKSFYKQTKLQFNDDGYAFAVYATLDIPDDKTFGSNTVFMGGDKSAFEMTVEEVPEFKTPTYNKEVFNSEGDFNKLILTSPAYVDKSIYEHCVFAITEQQSFRFLQTTIADTDSYFNLSKDKSKKTAPYKSEQFNLLKAGGVFYYKDDQLLDLEKELNQYPSFKQIGYNHYQTKIK